MKRDKYLNNKDKRITINRDLDKSIHGKITFKEMIRDRIQ